jgi:hypothetical protein
MKTERRKARRKGKMKIREEIMKEIKTGSAFCPVIEEYTSVCLEAQNYGEWNCDCKGKLKQFSWNFAVTQI